MGSIEEFPVAVPPEDAEPKAAGTELKVIPLTHWMAGVDAEPKAAGTELKESPDDSLEVRMHMGGEAGEGERNIAKKEGEHGAEQEKEKEKGKEKAESDEEREKRLEQEIAEAERSLENQAEHLRDLDQNWMANMDALEIAADRAGGRYENLSGAKGAVNSRKVEVSSTIKSIQRDLESQARALGRNDRGFSAREILDRQDRLLRETSAEFENLHWSVSELARGASDMAADFGATFGTKYFMEFENIWDINQPIEQKGPPGLMKRLQKFLDPENPVEGSAGAVSKAAREYQKKLCELPRGLFPDEVAYERIKREKEEGDTKREKEKLAEKSKTASEILFGVGEEETEEEAEKGKNTERKAA